MIAQYDFNDRQRMSQGVSENCSLEKILVGAIPGAASARVASESEDRDGTDWWVDCAGGHSLSVDVKVRSEDFAVKGQDDLALELWSDKTRKVVGWTLRDDKRTDYILWHWKDTGRWCLLPFPMLCGVFQENVRKWAREHARATQRSVRDGRQWWSECIFVPRKVVWWAIYEKYSGQSGM